MSNYPRLSEMGVRHTDQIAGYTVNSIDYTDFLRIDYDRPKDSFLPVRRTYEFPRAQKSLKSAGSDGQQAAVMESSAELREALEELNAIVGTRESKKGVAACILEEIQRLEDETAARSARIRELLGKLS
ncbi:MAG: DUF3461 family protein [Woeseiaceae bacterium]|nr:DUF3461 family protein [Woeseiaceae bacterium]